MGAGKEGARETRRVECVRVHAEGKGAFRLVSKRAEGGAEDSVVRSEAELVAFHKQLVKEQVRKLKRQASAVEAELAFPLVETNDAGLQRAMGLCALVACCAALAKAAGVGPTPILGSIPVEFVALGLAACCLVALSRSWTGSVEPAPVHQYLARAMKLEGAEPMLAALFERPQRPDWPARVGAIDLAVHDLPHSSSQTEWWYYNCHLEGPKGRPLSAFVCFFRILKHVDARGKRYYSHALTWSVSDVANKRYYSDVLLDRGAPEAILKSLDKGGLKDPILRRAFREVLEKGNVPLPDRLFETDAKVSNSALELDYEEAWLRKDDQGRYLVSAQHHCLPCALELVFEPRKDPVRHGDQGVVKGREGDDMFYYCISRCDVTGKVTVPRPHKRGGAASGAALATDELRVKGSGWYDHEFGGKPEALWDYGTTEQDASGESKGTAEKLMVRYAWNWAACQLNDNTEVTAAVLLDPVEGSIMEIKAIVVDADGQRQQFDETDGVEFAPVESPRTQWTSVRTFVDYPTSFRLVVPGAGLELTVTAAFADQEFMTMIAKPAFWEGRCDVVGTKEGTPVQGLAFVERNGFNPDQSIKAFFKAVGKKVRKSVQAMYPLEPTYEEGVELIASQDTKHYMKGVPLDVIGQTLIAPVRYIADRGGKSWRSYGALACVDCVGGDSRDFVDWVAMPEFLHVGSLIVDDIQDESETRRGGPAAHHKYGSALCINAGTAAYFQCEQMLKAPGLSPEDLNKCYALYFSALRGGHAGQALDIHGLDYMMDEVVETGDAALLEERILAIHMLKTAVPAGTLARMGALVGKGTDQQVEAMGLYFESVGIAFQIMDDVLNLRGLYSKESDKLKVGTELKQLGEDISCGKVTMPVAKAMGNIPDQASRRALWKVIQSKPHDRKTVDAVIAQLEELGAVEQCVQQAEDVVEKAWANLDEVIPDSFAKMMLRAFGTFVIERCQ